MVNSRSGTVPDVEGEPSSVPRRRKGLGTRSWLVVSESGESRVEEVGKYYIMRQTGLPARDLRVLDPALSYPSSILGRERAIVINIEHIRAIITAKEVFLLKSINPLVIQFVEDLKHRIVSLHRMPTQQPPLEPLLKRKSRNSADEKDDDLIETIVDVPEDTCPDKVLPFEFSAFEACLESACKCLESETKTLEEEAYPALDELTVKISTMNLERVRQIKSRLVAISARVHKVRDDLERLLDDDNNMSEMCLTEKLFANNSFDQTLASDDSETDEERDEREEVLKSSDKISEILSRFRPKIEELEMLLEAYFALIDGILQKLSHMSEYVKDTEDYINIMLDETQNKLLQMGVMISTATLILTIAIVICGIMGMNIHINLFLSPTVRFWETAAALVGGCVALYFIAVSWGIKKNLLHL